MKSKIIEKGESLEVIYQEDEYQEVAVLLEDLINNKIASSHYKNLLLDLSAVNMLNSMGVGNIMQLYKIFKQRQGILAIVQNAYLENLFKILGIASYLNLLNSFETAEEYITNAKKK